jgi:hypothetical protein
MEKYFASGFDDSVQAQIELRQRVEELEKIIIAMSSGAKFAISLDQNGRPQLSKVVPK